MEFCVVSDGQYKNAKENSFAFDKFQIVVAFPSWGEPMDGLTFHDGKLTYHQPNGDEAKGDGEREKFDRHDVTPR